ncbi:ABC transporter substrate-binding protein [Embleya sp. NPDC059259]|uniref:ABC transporter substrate-binding protein n=1 Tax=unclassified Embleya TaxID=2699296 RepID=UPI0036821AB6
MTILGRRRVAALATAGLVVAAVAGCGGSNTAESAGGKTLTLAAAADATSLDPAKGAGGNGLAYLQPLYDSLTTVNPDQSVGPGLATAWTYTDPERRNLRMTLREGVTFSDGTPFDATVVKQNLERTAAANGPSSFAVAAVASITVAGPTVVELALKTPDPSLLYNFGLVAGMMLSPKAFGDANAQPVGTGPYILDAGHTTRGDRYTYTRNPRRPDRTAYPFDKIVIKAIPDTNARTTALLTGQADAGLGAPARMDAAKGAGLTVTRQPGQVTGMWLVDREGKVAPQLKDVRVRRAINHAIDGPGILKAIMAGVGSPTTQMFAAGSPAYDPELDRAYPYDPARAKQLLAEAGLADGFKLVLPSENAFVPALYPVLAEQLNQVGIKVEYIPVSTNQLSQQYFSGRFPAFMYVWGTSQNWIDANALLSPAMPTNPFKVADPVIVDLLARIAKSPDEAQGPLYRQLNTHVVEQAWFAPLFRGDNVLFSAKSVSLSNRPGQTFMALTDYRPAG